MVPKNMTHLLQPLDLTTNGRLNKIKKKAFSEYFYPSILKKLKNDPTCDVTTIKVNLHLPTLKLLHVMLKLRKMHILCFLQRKGNYESQMDSFRNNECNP